MIDYEALGGRLYAVLRETQLDLFDGEEPDEEQIESALVAWERRGR